MIRAQVTAQPRLETLSPHPHRGSWIAVALLFAGAVALSCWVAARGVPLPGDIPLSRAVQALPFFATIEDGVNLIGAWSPLPFALVFLAVLFGRPLSAPRPQRREAITAFTTVVALSLLDQALKLLLRSPRPVAGDGVTVEAQFGSYGFPSGHVYADVLLLGIVAVYAPVWLPRRLIPPFRLLVVAIILLAAPARIYVGAHWPSDTLGGYLWGCAALQFAVQMGRQACSRRTGQSVRGGYV